MRQSLLDRYLGKTVSTNFTTQRLAHGLTDSPPSPIAIAAQSVAFSKKLNNDRKISANNSFGPGSVMLTRAEMTLGEVQCHLDRQGASNLVVELIIQNPNQNIFLMSVELGIALLEVS